MMWVYRLWPVYVPSGVPIGGENVNRRSPGTPATDPLKKVLELFGLKTLRDTS